MASNDPYTPPASLPEESPDSLRPTLANNSLLLVVMPLAASAIHLQMNRDSDPRSGDSMIFHSAVALLVLAGFFTALAALITRNGKKGVIVRAGFALLISGGILAVAASGFLKARDKAMARKAETEQQQQQPTKTLKDVRIAKEKQNAVVPPMDPQKLAEFDVSDVPDLRQPAAPQRAASQSMREAAQKMTGPEATALRIASEYIAAMETASKAHEVADTKLRDSGPLSPGRMNSKSALAERRELVKAVIATGEKYFELNLGMETYLHQALRREKLPEDFVKKFTEGFIAGRNNSPMLSLSSKARSANLRRCRALMNAVNLLDRELGKWVPAEGYWPVMQNRAAEVEYDKLMREIIKASNELVEIGRQQYALKTASR